MVEMSLQEAQLFRMLEAFFGRDRVIYNMSVRAVCGGSYPALVGEPEAMIARWAEVSGCLFTVVDDDDTPKMVIEFATDLTQTIDVDQMNRQQRLPRLLELSGVRYVLMTNDEFDEILDPDGSLDFVSVLKDRFGIDDSDETTED